MSSGALFGNVDATYHMRHDKVFIFSGAEDTVVHPGKFYVLMILCVSLKGNLIYSICMYIHAYILYTGLFLPFQTRGKNKKYCMGEYFHVHIYNNPSHKFPIIHFGCFHIDIPGNGPNIARFYEHFIHDRHNIKKVFNMHTEHCMVHID